MGIKSQRSALYVTDRGIEIEVSRMETPHLVNAIAHHTKQRQAIAPLIEMFTAINSNLIKRDQALWDTIVVLGTELARRDPDLDEREAQHPSRSDTNPHWED